jgi:hypothetical protein
MGEWMKIKMVLFALCAFVGATRMEAKPADLPGGCGRNSVKFEVKTARVGPPTLTPEPGKALVVFIETFDEPGTKWFPITTRFGMDDRWMGANKNNSYFTISVMPGEHRICSTRQGWGSGDFADSSPLSAEAGKVYFFEAKVHTYRNEGDRERAFHFKQITDDQGRSRVDASELSNWTTK